MIRLPNPERYTRMGVILYRRAFFTVMFNSYFSFPFSFCHVKKKKIKNRSSIKNTVSSLIICIYCLFGVCVIYFYSRYLFTFKLFICFAIYDLRR